MRWEDARAWSSSVRVNSSQALGCGRKCLHSTAMTCSSSSTLRETREPHRVLH